MFHNFNRKNFKKLKVLDHGCGTGRHVVFLAQQGIKTYGVDISQSGLEFTKKILEEKKLKAKLKLISNNNLPYRDNFFDGVISFAVLFYLNLEDIKKIIKEIRRVLKPQGKALFVLRSDKDYRYGRGKKIGENTFVIKKKNKSLNVSNENGMLMHFFNISEIKRLFKKFSIVQIDKMFITYNNQKFWDFDYVITVEK